MSAEVNLQSALYSALSGDATVSGLASVVDAGQQVGDGATGYPYIEVGYIDLRQHDTQRENGFDALIRLHTWSDSASMKETKTIQGAIYDVLHLGSLSITGHVLTLLRRDGSGVLRNADGTFHGVCEYRAIFEPA